MSNVNVQFKMRKSKLNKIIKYAKAENLSTADIIRKALDEFSERRGIQ